MAMTAPTFAYGVVILPPRDLYRDLLALRDRHPLLRSPAPPHITIKSPFLFRQSGAVVVETLEAICERWGPFEIRLSGLGVFRSSILYVRVDESKELNALHQEMLDDLAGFVESLSDRWDGNGFTPHLTVADKLAPNDLSDVRRAVSDFRFHRRFTVDRIHLLRGKGRWDITRSFRLGSE